MVSNKICVLPNRTTIVSVLMFQMFALIILCHIGFFITETTAAQKFYPNGRYGRRSVLPPLMPSADSSEDAITFIGNVATNKLSKGNALNTDQPIALLCYFMGRSDLLKCSLRETANEVLERNNNESQQ